MNMKTYFTSDADQEDAPPLIGPISRRLDMANQNDFGVFPISKEEFIRRDEKLIEELFRNGRIYDKTQHIFTFHA